MSYFNRKGNTYYVSADDSMDLKRELPAGNYIVQRDAYGNFYLEHIEDFTPPGKVYGDCISNADRIINTFLDRSGNTGVLLTGEKGSGKTLLARQLSIDLARKHGVPTIAIGQPWVGDDFNKFLQLIVQPCMVLFDEFEKIYSGDDQEKTLTLLDGVFNSNKLFVFTVNDSYRVNSHMRNRPGRIYYSLQFSGLEANFIREYCEDRLQAKQHIQKIVDISSIFGQFNFDMLKALVEEMNRYGETPQEAIRMLNAKPENDGGSVYDVEMSVNGKKLELGKSAYPENYCGNPLVNEIEVNVVSHVDEDGDDEWQTIKFTTDRLVSFKEGNFVFNDPATGIRLALTRKRSKIYDYYGAF